MTKGAPYDPKKYDPKKRRERYLRDRQLKGRRKGPRRPPAVDSYGNVHPGFSKNPKKFRDNRQTQADRAKARARVAGLQKKVSKLESALTKTMAQLVQKRLEESKKAKASSDGKSTAEEKRKAKEYRDKNKAKIEAKRKEDQRKASSSKSGGSSSSSSKSSEASVDDLEARVRQIRSTLSKARTLLQKAKAGGGLSHSETQAGVLWHSALISRKESVLMTDADFGGWATRHDVQCSDGRTILPGAFADQDGLTVPLVYDHSHNSIEDVLGHAKLEYVPPTDSEPGGMYAHAYFNKTPKGQLAKEQVRHGDLKFLSIFANDLREKVRDGVAHAKDVVKGQIREVSLVLAGANSGAYIDHVSFAHGDDGEYETAAVISMGVEIEVGGDLKHSDEDAEETLEEVLSTLTHKQAVATNFLLAHALNSLDSSDLNGKDLADMFLEHAENSDDDDEDEETLEDILDSMNEKQSTAVNFLLAQALAHSAMEESSSDADEEESSNEEDSEDPDAENEADSVGDGDTNNDGDTDTDEDAGASSHDNLQEDTSMSHNIFDKSGATAGSRPSASLQHGSTSMEDALRTIVKNAKKNGSLKEALEDYIEHTGIMVGGTLTHGVENLDYLFPDAQTLENSPAYLSRRMEWVDKVLSGVRKSPFSRIKTITADITPDEARARGYITGNFKNEEFFALSKRETTPQTIYKKQRLDRDDVIDITTLDVVAWLKAEMKVMLDEELAGAILIGDGRSIGHEDKILENHIRPIASDAELYVTTVRVNIDDANSTVEELVDAVIENRRYYKGTGTPTFFTTESVISAFLTVKDNFGRRLYSNLNEVAAVLRVSEVVPVEVMERVDDLVGIMVNLADYTLGADRGGQATMFDDFDIDYNKLIYLIETRCSGALTQPKAAIVFRKVDAALQLVEPEYPTFENNLVTVPTVTGVEYRNADTNAVLTTANPVGVAPGSTLNVVAVPASGYFFRNSETDQWSFTNHDD